MSFTALKQALKEAGVPDETLCAACCVIGGRGRTLRAGLSSFPEQPGRPHTRAGPTPQRLRAAGGVCVRSGMWQRQPWGLGAATLGLQPIPSARVRRLRQSPLVRAIGTGRAQRPSATGSWTPSPGPASLRLARRHHRTRASTQALTATLLDACWWQARRLFCPLHCDDVPSHAACGAEGEGSSRF